MERLTERSTGIHVNYLNNYNNSILCSEMSVPQIKECMEKLAKYEDTGLEPEEITKVIKAGVPEWIDEYLEYRKLEAEGRFIKFSCAAGDIVYEANINRDIVSTYKITSITLMTNSRNYGWELMDGIYSNLLGFNEFALGKTVFLTREEAEKALEQ